MPNNIEKSARTQVALVILSLIGIGLVLVSTSRYGVGLSPDSTSYISAARSLSRGSGYLSYDGSPLVSFPPLFPMVLSILDLIGIEPLNGARYFNAFAFGLIIFASGQLFRMHIRSKALVILGTFSILLSYPLLRVSTYAWSDPLFTLLAVLFIIYSLKFLNQRGSVVLLSLSIIAALSCLQRYIGITIILTGLVLFAFMPKISLTQRLKYAIVFALISIVPLAVWGIRNYKLTSTFTGERAASQTTFLNNTFRALNVLTKWFVPYEVPFWIGLIGSIFVVFILITVIHFLHYKLNKGLTAVSLQLWPAFVFVLVYIIFLIASSTNVALEAISDRLLVPIYVFVMFFVFISIDQFEHTVEFIPSPKFSSLCFRLIPIAMILAGVVGNEFVLVRYSTDGDLAPPTISAIRLFQAILLSTGIFLLIKRRIALAYNKLAVYVTEHSDRLNLLNQFLRKQRLRNDAAIVLCIIWLMCSLVHVSKEILDLSKNGAGRYNTVMWRESSLMGWIRTHPLEGKVYSNAPDAIYILTGLSARMSPWPESDTDALSKFRKILTLNSDTYLAWFDNCTRTYLYSVQELRSIFDMETVATCSDGSVYLVRMK